MPKLREKPSKTKLSRGGPVSVGKSAGPYLSLMTIRELSSYLNVSRSTIRRLHRSGQIPAMRVGKQLRFDAIAVRAALDKRS